MTKLLTFFASLKHPKIVTDSDFSAFFAQSSGKKKKVIDQILKEANAEQRKTVENYRKRTTVGS